jgi:phospholipid-binding lipoprotein MlaA
VRAGRCTALSLLTCLALLASGCATSDFSVRRLPAETPAADNAAAIQQRQAMLAQAEARARATPETGIAPLVTPEEAPSMHTYDPWERMNRFTYRFNARFDEALFLPAVDAYRRLPSFMRTGINNFFSNLGEVVSVLNYTAQLRPALGVRSLGRFVINSTIGIGGLFDVATKMHLPEASTGFSDTLTRWGMHPGPYLVMPLLGPSSLRGGVGSFADYGTEYAINLADLYQGNVSWVLTPLEAVDTRANINFRYFSTGSPFEYDAVRFLFVRKTLIQDDALRIWRRSGEPNAQIPAGE